LSVRQYTDLACVFGRSLDISLRFSAQSQRLSA
jgi:hypothetical protein